MSYLDLFQRYGSPSREAEIRPARLPDPTRYPGPPTAIQYNDETAARLIEDCRRLADQLTEYRRPSRSATPPSQLPPTVTGWS